MNLLARCGFRHFVLAGLFQLSSLMVWAQGGSLGPVGPMNSSSVLRLELLYGQSAEANDFFPERSAQYSFIAALGYKPSPDQNYWARTLKGTETGILAMYTELGNPEALGQSYTLMPYLRFPAFGQLTHNLSAQFGLGATYFNTIYDPETNFYNQAVTTPVTWAFRGSLHHQITQLKNWQISLGAVYNHQSNGHTKLPNQGLNSFLFSLSGDHSSSDGHRSIEKMAPALDSIDFESQAYVSGRFGYGLSIFALAFNDVRPVRTFELTYGQIHQNTFKWGLGIQYRFYQHYYDYIQGNESLVQDGAEFADFRTSARRYAANIGVHIDGELLLDHFGISAQLGLNLWKPAYNIDWRINEGWDYPPRELPPNWELGTYNTKFSLKKHLSTRLGLRYYLLGQKRRPKHDFYMGVHLNANFGQADFSELSIGYIYSWQR